MSARGSEEQWFAFSLKHHPRFKKDNLVAKNSHSRFVVRNSLNQLSGTSFGVFEEQDLKIETEKEFRPAVETVKVPVARMSDYVRKVMTKKTEKREPQAV